VKGVAEGEPRLRRHFTSTFGGNAVFAASQWAILSLIAKLGSAEMLGEYALGLAVAAPVALFSHLNLRAVLATDIEQRHPFGDYLALRLRVSAAAFGTTVLMAALAGYGWKIAAAIVLGGAILGFDALSDIYYGALQRRERMDRIAVSMCLRGFTSAAAMGTVLWLTGSLLMAMAAQIAARAAVLLCFDRPSAGGEAPHGAGRGSEWRIFRSALPLGIVLMLGSLTSNLPRYAVERWRGVGELGAFAALASFLTLGATVVNALGQAATPRLARHFSAKAMPAFYALAWRLVALALALGLVGVAAVLLLGPWVLRLIYRPSFAVYADVLVWVMAAAVLNYVASMLGYVITATRAFSVQAPLFAGVAAVCGAAAAVLVPRMGLTGAAVALACGWAVQIAGELFILARMARPRESAG
jgi:O-antigen/teichoic acid export membrane protein